MSMAHNPNLIAVLAGGVPLGDFLKDVFVEVNYDEPAVTTRETVQGLGIFNVKRSRRATVIVKLEPNSIGNTIFTAYFEAQSKTGGGMFAFAVVDNNVPDGQSSFNSPSTRIAQMPNQGWGDEAQTLEWTLLCTDVTHRIRAVPNSSALPG